jgi:hypothetical protein
MFITSLLVPACEEQTMSDPQTEEKRTRMIAAGLKEEMSNLKKQHARELSEQKKLLDNCLRENDTLARISAKDTQKLMDDLWKSVGEKSVALQQENDALKAQVKELEEELQKLRAADSSTGS